MVITPDLANRLEGAEALHLSRQVHICAQLRPELGACIVQVAGGVAAFTAGEYGRKLNHVTGFGLDVSATENDLITLETAYAKLGLATEIDLCPFVNADNLKLLANRTYAVNAFSNTYVTAVSGDGNTFAVDPRIKIEKISPDGGDHFLAVSIAGFAKQRHDRPAALIEILAKIAVLRKDTVLYVARIDGQIVGSAGLALLDLPEAPVAHLYIASTLPASRGRGVQQALIQARLVDARRAGFEIASITARPDSASSRNASRAGFSLAYTKSTFALSSAGAATET